MLSFLYHTCFLFLQEMIAVSLTTKMHTMKILVLDSIGPNLGKLNTLRTLSSGHGIELGFFSRVQNHMNLDVEPGFPKVIL